MHARHQRPNPTSFIHKIYIGHYREPSGLWKTVSYFFHAMMLVDLLALAPFYFRTVVERVAPSLMESGGWVGRTGR